MEKKSKNEIVKDVVEQIINMMENNILADYGSESFECWCADGEVFGNNVDKEEQMALVTKFAPYVDALSNAIENEME